MRRRALLAEARDDLEAVEFRGNLDTRLRKVEDGEVDAAIVAAAGLERLLGTEEAARIGAPLGADWWVPPPGQGALAIEALSERSDLSEVLAPLEDASDACGAHRRARVRTAAGGWMLGPSRLLGTTTERQPPAHRIPRAARRRVRRSATASRGPRRTPQALGRELAEAVLDSGGDEILEELQYEEAPTVEAP